MTFRIKLIYKYRNQERIYFDKSEVPRPYNRALLRCAAVLCEKNGCQLDSKTPEDAWFPVSRYKEALMQRIRRVGSVEIERELMAYCKLL